MKRILIATDESISSIQAVHRYVAILGAEPANVRVLSVIPVRDDVDVPGQHYHRAAEAALESLDRAMAELARAGHTAEAVVRVGVPAATIIEAAREFGADMVVMGTHDPRRAGVAAEVLRGAPCGVLVFSQTAAVA